VLRSYLPAIIGLITVVIGILCYDFVQSFLQKRLKFAGHTLSAVVSVSVFLLILMLIGVAFYLCALLMVNFFGGEFMKAGGGAY